MTAEKFVTLWCNTAGCDEFIDTDFGLTSLARTQAKGLGWSSRRSGNYDYCPACTRTRARLSAAKSRRKVA